MLGGCLRGLKSEDAKFKRLLAEAHLDIHALNTAFWGKTRSSPDGLGDRDELQ